MHGKGGTSTWIAATVLGVTIDDARAVIHVQAGPSATPYILSVPYISALALGGLVAKTVIDLDEEALTLAMAHYGTKVKKEAVNRALRDAAGRREVETDDLADWFQEVGRRLAEVDPRKNAWRQ